jgi:hypothetical protein
MPHQFRTGGIMQKTGWTIALLAAIAFAVTVALPLSDASAVHSPTVHANTAVGSGPDSGFPYD